MESTAKRPRTAAARSKQVGKWRAQARGYNPSVSASGIHGDDVGFFVTCDKGQEKKCLWEVRDLLGQYGVGDGEGGGHKEAGMDDKVADDEDEEIDIESSIAAELQAMKQQDRNQNPNSRNGVAASKDSIALITLDIPCVSFVRLPRTADPVAIISRICADAAASPSTKRSRYIKRLTPMTLMRKTLSGGLEGLCDVVLPSHFQGEKPVKFAIRPTVRNNQQLNRDEVIKTVAGKVEGLGKHTVDLKGYDLLVLVDVYRNVCGMSVVGREYETLKRFNLAEIYEPSRDEGGSGEKKGDGMIS